jgi:uncharacterized Zn finger protein (UPF0148 family)
MVRKFCSNCGHIKKAEEEETTKPPEEETEQQEEGSEEEAPPEEGSEEEEDDSDSPDSMSESLPTRNLRDKMQSVMSDVALTVAKAVARHNLEQFWWEKMSGGVDLEPHIYEKSVAYIADFAEKNGPEFYSRMKNSLEVFQDEVQYGFPLNEDMVKGDFSIKIPTKIIHKREEVEALNLSQLKSILLQEYAKWLGTHILFEDVI